MPFVSRVVPVLFVLALAVAGCGGDDEPAARTIPGATATASAAPPTTPDGPSATAAAPPTTPAGAPAPATGERVDEQIAEQGLLDVADLPAGTKEEPGEAATVSPCRDVEAAKNTASAREPAKDFVLKPDTNATHALYVYADDAAAEKAYAGLTSPATRRCLADSLGDTVGASLERSGRAKVARVRATTPPVPGLGGTSHRTAIEIALRVGGRTQKLPVEIVMTRIGRALSISTVTAGELSAIQLFANAAAEKLTRTLTELDRVAG